MQRCSAKGVKRLNMKRNTHFHQIQPSAIDESIGNDALLQKHAFNIPHSPYRYHKASQAHILLMSTMMNIPPKRPKGPLLRRFINPGDLLDLPSALVITIRGVTIITWIERFELNYG